MLWSDIRTRFQAAKNDVEELQRDLAGFNGGTPDEVLKSLLEDLQNSISSLQTQINTANTNLTAHNTSATAHADIRTLINTAPLPVTFVFGGVPAISSTINVPLTVNLAIAVNLSGSRYYNQVNPTAASTFTLTRITAAGGVTTIGTISKPAGTGAATFSGTGSSVLVAGDTLRMTATTVGQDLTDVSISIHATRRL